MVRMVFLHQGAALKFGVVAYEVHTELVGLGDLASEGVLHLQQVLLEQSRGGKVCHHVRNDLGGFLELSIPDQGGHGFHSV